MRASIIDKFIFLCIVAGFIVLIIGAFTGCTYNVSVDSRMYVQGDGNTVHQTKTTDVVNEANPTTDATGELAIPLLP